MKRYEGSKLERDVDDKSSPSLDLVKLASWPMGKRLIRSPRMHCRSLVIVALYYAGFTCQPE